MLVETRHVVNDLVEVPCLGVAAAVTEPVEVTNAGRTAFALFGVCYWNLEFIWLLYLGYWLFGQGLRFVKIESRSMSGMTKSSRFSLKKTINS